MQCLIFKDGCRYVNQKIKLYIAWVYQNFISNIGYNELADDVSGAITTEKPPILALIRNRVGVSDLAVLWPSWWFVC